MWKNVILVGLFTFSVAVSGQPKITIEVKKEDGSVYKLKDIAPTITVHELKHKVKKKNIAFRSINKLLGAKKKF